MGEKLVITIFLIIFSLISTSVSAKNSNPELVEIAPPKLVECKTKGICDHDQQHLEEFVRGFYNWYMVSSDLQFSPSWDKLSKEEHKKRLEAHWKKEQNIIKQNITRHFQEWIDKGFVDGEMVDVPDDLYCGSGVNYFTCSQDIGDDWINNASAELIAIGSNRAVLLVKMPPNPTPDQFSKTLSVTIKPEGGFWKIHSVKDLWVYDPDSDK
jgi:hypothetical protein